MNKTLEASPSMSDERCAECLWGYKGSSEVIVRNNQQYDHATECDNNSDVKLITDENDDEFDDFKSAPGGFVDDV